MKENFKKWLSVGLFYAIAIGLRFYICRVRPDFYLNSNFFVQALLEGMGPLIGGLVVVYLFKRPMGLTILGQLKWQSVIMFIVPIVLLALTTLIWGGNALYTAYFSLVVLLYGAYEEYGWRGYLQSELKGMKKIVRILLIAVLWHVWHLNFSLSINNLFFFLFLIFGSFGIGIIADKTKSLLACACFHSIVNIIYAKSVVLVGIQFAVVGICVILWCLMIYNKKIEALFLKKEKLNIENVSN